ncbi:hypothetical protein D3C81_1372900 [compost metagenome]
MLTIGNTRTGNINPFTAVLHFHAAVLQILNNAITGNTGVIPINRKRPAVIRHGTAESVF